ncbi:MAG: GNAT family N-acetyltransferase [Acholeplasma sp.]|jgi:hypothetical protein|nr:GNAT family N-acetyltransferase [Acholeplasma sp.]
MIKVSNPNEYYPQFDSYPVFHNFIKYAIKDLSPDIYVDQLDHPNCYVLYSYPAYFILGKPSIAYETEVCQLFGHNSWIINNDISWDVVLKKHFDTEIQSHPKIQFDSNKLSLEHILQYKKPLPSGLKIVPIDESHLVSGMVKADVVSRFFTVSSFKEHGYGFVLVDDSNHVKGFALTNYPMVGKEIELYFRVGYDFEINHRNQGLGTALCAYFIEETYKRGLIPIWDSANEISAHIARKLGFVEMIHWSMYHVL